MSRRMAHAPISSRTSHGGRRSTYARCNNWQALTDVRRAGSPPVLGKVCLPYALPVLLPTQKHLAAKAAWLQQTVGL